MNAKSLLFLLFCLCGVYSFAQTAVACDTIYANPEVGAKYKDGEHTDGEPALLHYIMKDLSKTLVACYKPQEELITKLLMEFTIDNTGKVISIIFFRFTGSKECEAGLRKEIMKMPSWTPAQVAGKNVCSRYRVPLGCIKWDK